MNNFYGIVEHFKRPTEDGMDSFIDYYFLADSFLNKVPASMFDVTLFCILAEFGFHSNSIAIFFNRISEIIDITRHPFAYDKIHDCKSLNDFLVKNNFVNSDNTAALDKYIIFGNAKVEEVYNALKICARKQKLSSENAQNNRFFLNEGAIS